MRIFLALMRSSHHLPRPRGRLVLAALCASIYFVSCGGDGNEPVDVVLTLGEKTGKLAQATILVNYSRAGASPLLAGGAPACTYIMPFVDGAFSDDGNGRMKLLARSARGFSGPGDIAACRMVPDLPETAVATVSSRLEVRLTQAQDSEGREIDIRLVRSASDERGRAGGAASKGAAGAAAWPARAGAQGTKPGVAGKAGPAVAPKRPGAPGSQQKAAAKPNTANATGAPARPPAPAVKPAPPTKQAPPIKPPPPPPAASPKTPAASARGSIVLTPGQGSTPAPAPTPRAQPQQNPTALPLPPEEDDYDDSSADSPDAPEYDVTVSLVSSPAPLGSLQFTLSHLGQEGNFEGDGGEVDCVSLGNAMNAANNTPGRSVRVGLISLRGIEIGPIVSCFFRTFEPLTTQMFLATVSDAADVDVQRVMPQPEVAVTQIQRR